MSVEAGRVEEVDLDRSLKQQQNEERRLAEMMIPKKKKRLYNKIMHSKKRKAKEVRYCNTCMDCVMYCTVHTVFTLISTPNILHS